jgi:hypothetical protein
MKDDGEREGSFGATRRRVVITLRHGNPSTLYALGTRAVLIS